MFKIAGIIMIILSGTLLGFSKSAALKIRKDSLGKILYSLRVMENEISYGKYSMDKIFEKITKLGGLEFYPVSEEPAKDCFLRAVNCSDLSLAKADTEILTRFSQSLGVSDSASQLKNIKNTIKSLEFMAEEAEKNFDKYGKMYRSMGTLVSLLVVILLI